MTYPGGNKTTLIRLTGFTVDGLVCCLKSFCWHVCETEGFFPPLSWKVPPILLDKQFSDFTPDITPIILAAHTNNYEIIKLLVQKGVSMPQPHEVSEICIFESCWKLHILSLIHTNCIVKVEFIAKCANELKGQEHAAMSKYYRHYSA